MCENGLDVPAGKKILVAGAGNIGLGVVGRLFGEAGWHVTFYRKNQDRLRKLRDMGYYVVTQKDPSRELYTYIHGFECVFESDLAEKIAETDVVACCVYEDAFPDICSIIAEALKLKAGAGRNNELDILLCVNQLNAARQLHRYIDQEVEGNPGAERLLETATGISRVLVLSAAMPDGAAGKRLPCEVICVSGDGSLEIERETFLGPQNTMKGITFTDGVGEKLVRKVYLGNMRHTMAACMGALKGYQTIDECHQDPEIRRSIITAFKEAEKGYFKEYGIEKSEQEEYQNWKKRLDEKMDIRTGDQIRRIVSNPVKKLGREERFTGPALLCVKHGIKPEYLALGIASCLGLPEDYDSESGIIQSRIGELGIERAVREFCGLRQSEREEAYLTEEIVRQYKKLEVKTRKEEWQNEAVQL